MPAVRRSLTNVLASASRLTSRRSDHSPGARGGRSSGDDWQSDAWEMYDLVGEQRFLASTLANRMGQARLFVGRLPDDPTDDIEPVEGQQSLMALLGSGSSLAQIIQRLGVNLFVAGEGWLVGLPPRLADPEADPGVMTPGEVAGLLPMESLEWRALSVSEVSMNPSGALSLHLDGGEGVEVSPDEVYLIRIWRPHPRRGWEADSPTRSSLPVLRELVGLTMHVSAQVDSRLAGAGLLVVPQSAIRAMNVAAGLPPDAEEDQFTEGLMEAMLTPVEDRSAAAALVPLIATVPDESVGNFKHLTFAQPLDGEARQLRDEAIRRLALGQDAPPELLLGTAGMNHWGAWLVREDVVSTHIEPPLALICDALTTEWLRPVLESRGMSATEAARYVVHYDVGHMMLRPNRAAEALTLFDRGALSADTLRDASGFDEGDAPVAGLDGPTALVLDLVRASPGLVASPGIGPLLEQVRALLSGRDVPDNPAPPMGSGSEPPPPAVPEPPADPSAVGLPVDGAP